MKTRLYSVLKFAIGWPLSVLAFLFIAKIIYDQAPSLSANIHQLNPVLLGYGILSFIIYYFLRSYIWFRILKAFSYKLPFRSSNYLWAMSELKRYIPGSVWSFLGRAVLFGTKGVEKKDTGKGLIIEAEIFVLGSFIVSLSGLPMLVPDYNALIGWAAFIVVFVGSLAFIFNRKLLHFIHNDKLKVFLPPFHPLENILHLVLSASGLFFFGLGNYLVISSIFFLDPQQLPQLIGVFVFAFVIGYLSIVTPAGFGVREGIVVFGLSKFLAPAAAAFSALFSRLLLIISELMYIAVTYLWNSLSLPRKIEKWCAEHPHELIVIGMCLIYTIYFSSVSFLRYDHFYAGRFDLGNMAQTVWNTSRGDIFMFTNPDSTEEITRLAFHADFFLILLAPFYWIWPDPRMLLLIQTIIVAAGAYFVYLLSVRILNNKIVGIVLAFAYLINPSIERANIYDFHAATLVTTFLLGAFYFYLKKDYKWFAVFAVLAGLCKEQIWAIIAIFGIFLMVHQKKFIAGALVFFFSAGIFYFLVSYAIPHASPKVSHFALQFFSDYGDTPAAVIKTVILSPDKIIAVFFEDEHLRYLKQLFSPLGYLSYLAPVFLVFAGPDLLINILSNNSQFHQIYYQYTAAISPFIFIAAIYGIWVLQWVLKPKNLALFYSLVCLYILYFSVMAAYHFGPLPGSQEPNIAMFTKPEKNQKLINKTLEQIPPGLKVAASNNIGSHLSNRKQLYVLPVGADKADVLVFLLTDSEHGTSFLPEQELVRKLSNDPRYKIIVQKDEFTVFQKK